MSRYSLFSHGQISLTHHELPVIMEIMVETVFRIMKALNYYPRFVLREVEPASFNYPEQSSTRGGGYSGPAPAKMEA